MVNFLKSFGKGLLYLLVLPAIIVGVAIYGVVGIFIFIFLAFKGLVLFFKGKSLFDDLPEDIEAKKRLHPMDTSSVKTTPNLSFDTAVMPSNNGEPVTEPTEDPFYVPEYLKPEDATQTQEETIAEEPVEEPNPVNEPVVEETPILEEEIVEEEPEEDNCSEEEVVLDKKPSQNTTILEISDIEDDEETEEKDSSGIDIEFH